LCGNEKLLPYVHELVATILPSLSHEVATIQDQAIKANGSLLNLIQSTQQDFAIDDFLTNVTVQFNNDYVNTRLAALRWVLIIHYKAPEKLETYVDSLFPALLKLLHDPAELVCDEHQLMLLVELMNVH
jgi:vacuole morphology and inheritance protein 14